MYECNVASRKGKQQPFCDSNSWLSTVRELATPQRGRHTDTPALGNHRYYRRKRRRDWEKAERKKNEGEKAE